MLNRRYFILTGASSLALSVLTPSSIASTLISPNVNPKTQIDELTSDNIIAQFSSKLNDKYFAWNQTDSMYIKLEEVHEGPVYPGLDQFDLTFSVNDVVKPEGLYHIAHLKSNDLHQVYFEHISDSDKYRAVFCMFKQPT